MHRCDRCLREFKSRPALTSHIYSARSVCIPVTTGPNSPVAENQEVASVGERGVDLSSSSSDEGMADAFNNGTDPPPDDEYESFPENNLPQDDDDDDDDDDVDAPPSPEEVTEIEPPTWVVI